MATRYWVGGSGTWDATDTSHWSATSGGAGGASVPGSADRANIDYRSAGAVITLATNPTLVGLTLGGGTLALTTYAVTTGNLSLGGGTGNFYLDFGTTGKITITGSGFSLSCSTAAGFSVLNPRARCIYFTGTTAQNFYGGNKTWPGIVNQCANILSIFDTNTFNDTFEAQGPATYYFEKTKTQTFTGTISWVGTLANRVTLRSDSITGVQATLSQAAGLPLTVTYADIKDLNATGGQSWLATGSIDGGNNTGWTFGAAPVGSSGNMFPIF